MFNYARMSIMNRPASNDPVVNLRKIWDSKKIEMEVTQTEAAGKLGWTQGAFAQYVNGLTVMSPQTITKLANFLSVDPRDIDPNIGNHLPENMRMHVGYTTSDAKTKHKSPPIFYDQDKLDSFYIKVDEENNLRIPLGAFLKVTKDTSGSQRASKNNVLYVARVKDKKSFIIAHEDELAQFDVIEKFTLLNVQCY
jgi:transcriptional regulator with XRE-family HTH domain